MKPKPSAPRKPRFDLARLLDDDRIGIEARVAEADHQSLKLWLRLLACSTQIEIEIRRRLRERFGVSLPRFDFLAQLHRHPDGLRMNTLSRYLMVSGGNVTGLTDELEKDGLVSRDDDPDDRRSYRVRLTPGGRRAFERMASEHEGWLVELFAGLESEHKQALYEGLGRLRVNLVAVQGGHEK
ncbi:MAG: MarR family transcriptional regulator [Rubrivivax sp.]|nr:MarR family transcriptional regulator [Rubrivivax sp.]MBK7264602.1 MarR family transcriptional regulator [Rubrivivax sp.]MBK8529936.1 MarR family transcriptional regulator [Rubrivivax sp.]